jgi:uncharacterized repeat protein (TIGR01451 family)
MKTYAALPMMFEANNGQTDSRVKFLAHAPGYTLFLTDNEAVLSLPTESAASASGHTGQHSKNSASRHLEELGTPKLARVVRLRFAGAGTPAAITGREQLRAKTNYIIGSDPKQWHTNVSNYSAVEYRGIYSGVDAVFHGNQQHLEYDFIVAPDANPNAIALEVEGGANKLHIGPAGEVIITLVHDQHGETRTTAESRANITLLKPVVYQETAGKRHDIQGEFTLLAGNKIGFAVGPYDHSQPLVIDPTLVYSSVLSAGGTVENIGVAIAVDLFGSAYVTGQTGIPGFPTTSGAFETTTKNPLAAFVTKFSPDGSELRYSTYVGGSNDDASQSIAVDSSGNAYITGSTSSSDFPTTAGSSEPNRPTYIFNGGPTPYTGAVPFVTKLSSDGSTLVYSTYVAGGTRFQTCCDIGRGIAVDAAGEAYIMGVTYASNFPVTTGAFQTTYNASLGDDFVSKLSADGSALVFSTYLGGSGQQNNAEVSGLGGRGSGGIAVDSSGNAYVTDITYSSNFPTTTGAFQTSPKGSKGTVFVTKFAPAGTVVYSTLLGGSQSQSPGAIAVDSTDSAFVMGTTTSSDFPVTSGTAQGTCAGGSPLYACEDVFVTKLDPSGASLVYSTFLGGSSEDFGTGIAVDPQDSAIVVGLTASSNFPTTPDALYNYFCATSGCFSDFITKLSPNGSAFVSSSIFPPTASDSCCLAAVAVDLAGNAYMTGANAGVSGAFPITPGAFQTSNPNSEFSAFLSEIAFVAPPFASFSPSPPQLNFGNVSENTTAALPLTVTNTGAQPLALDLVILGVQNPGGFSYTQVVCGGVTEPLPLPVPLIVNAGADNACTFTVQFDPATAGPASSELTFLDSAPPGESNLTSTSINGGPYAQIVPLSGTGLAPAPPTANLAFSETAPSTVSLGSTISYTLTVTNNGPATATNVVVTDTLPSGVIFGSGTCSSAANQTTTAVGGTQASGLNTATCQFLSITDVSGANIATMTFTATFSSNPTNASTLTSTATVTEDQTDTLTATATATTTVSTSGGGGSGPAGCTGCSTTGPYVAPNAGSIPAPSSGTNSVSVSSDGTVTVLSGGKMLGNPLSIGADIAGLSPDGATLAAHVPGGGVYVYNLMSSPPLQSIGPTPLIGNSTGAPYRIEFSPSGQYLAYTTAATPVAGQSPSATLIIYNVRTHKMVYENSNFSFYSPGSTSGIEDPTCSCQLAVDAYGNIGAWGFSPDNPETTFVYAYLTDPNDVQWNLVHLEQPPTSGTVGSATSVPLTSITSAFWQFSPCGDVIAIVTQPSSSFEEIQFIRTADGTLISDQSSIPFGNITLASSSTQQVATDVTSGPTTQTYTVDDSANNRVLSASLHEFC